MNLKISDAKKFFSSLYEEEKTVDTGHFDLMVTRLIAQMKDQVIVGDQALQGIMINYVLSNPENAKRGQSISASLAGIKQKAVDDFVKTFPKANMDTLIKSAKEAGYEINLLK